MNLTLYLWHLMLFCSITSWMSRVVRFYLELISRLIYFYRPMPLLTPSSIFSTVLSFSSTSCSSLQFCRQHRSFSLTMAASDLEFQSRSSTSFSSARFRASARIQYFFLVQSRLNLAAMDSFWRVCAYWAVCFSFYSSDLHSYSFSISNCFCCLAVCSSLYIRVLTPLTHT